MKIELSIRQQSTPYNAYTGYVSFPLTSDWNQVSVTGTVGDTGDVLLMFHAITAGTFWVDDVMFTNASGTSVSGGVPWHQSSFGELRLWDSGTAWTALEPAKGVWNWAPIDAWVPAASHANVGLSCIESGIPASESILIPHAAACASGRGRRKGIFVSSQQRL